MRPHERIVTSMPLTELWDARGPLRSTRLRDVDPEDLRTLLRGGPVRFVIADAGRPLRWLPLDECFPFWKAELREHLCRGERFFLETYPGAYCFVASEWRLPTEERVILLERHH